MLYFDLKLTNDEKNVYIGRLLMLTTDKQNPRVRTTEYEFLE